MLVGVRLYVRLPPTYVFLYFGLDLSATALLQVPLHQYSVLPPSNILTLLQSKPLNVGARVLGLVPTDMLLFSDLQKGIIQINKAIKAFKKRTEKSSTTA